MKYPKIYNLWKRDSEGLLIEGEFCQPEFENVKLWDVSEKIDGMNIRITYGDALLTGAACVSYKGRGDKSKIPAPLLAHLEKTFPLDFFTNTFPDAHYVVIFGEGYGPKIQKGGGLYRKDQGFIGFDIYIDGWWLKQMDVCSILCDAGIKWAHQLGRNTIEHIVEFVKTYPSSFETEEEKMIEGIVARSSPLMLFRKGLPVMFKLKCKDYMKLEGKKKNDR